MSDIGGTIQITADGRAFVIGEAATFHPGGVERAEKVARSGQVNFTQRPTAAYVEFDLHQVEDSDPRELIGLTNATVVVQWGGQTWQIRKAFYTGPQEIDLAEGESRARFVGPPADKV